MKEMASPTTTTTATATTATTAPCPATVGSSSSSAQAWIVLLVSLLAVPVCYGLFLLHSSHLALEEDVLFAVAVGLCLLVWLLSYVLLRLLTPAPRGADPFLALFSFFSFTCVVDLLLAFNIDGWIDWLSFYLQHGEKYLLSNHGAAINYWDGFIHLPLYVVFFILS